MAEQRKPGYRALSFLLSKKRVVELREIAQELGYQFKSGVLKARMVEVLGDIMLKEPVRIIRSAFHYELKAWRDIIDGKMTAEEAELARYPYELNRFALVYITETRVGGRTSLLCFQEDMAERLRPLIDRELLRRESDGSLEMEKLALGLANAYGFTDLFQILDHLAMLEKHLGRKIDDEELDTIMYPILCITRPSEDKEMPLISPLVEFGGIGDDVQWDLKPKQFDLQTLLALGEMPYPKFRGKYADNLKKTLTKYADNDITTPESMMRQFFIDKQRKMDSFQLPDLSGFKIEAMNDAQEAIQAIIEFMNGVPYWRLMGNSSEETARKDMQKMRAEGRTPKISIGPSMRAMGIESWEQVQEMARKGEDFPPFPGDMPFGEAPFADPYVRTEKKVGRNDPCPCGSGKKYKHCCGR